MWDALIGDFTQHHMCVAFTIIYLQTVTRVELFLYKNSLQNEAISTVLHPEHQPQYKLYTISYPQPRKYIETNQRRSQKLDRQWA